MKIALCQMNPVVGDLAGNGRRIADVARHAAERGAELAVFPQLSLAGAPLLGLAERAAFLDDVERAVARLAAEVPAGLGVLVGAPVREGGRARSAALLLEGGRVAAEVLGARLPACEACSSEPGGAVVAWRGRRLGVFVGSRPPASLASEGAELLLGLTADPFWLGRREAADAELAAFCRAHGLPLALVGPVGANAEFIFEGDSRAHRADGARVLGAPPFEEALLLWDTEAGAAPFVLQREPVEDLHDALVLGIRDYVEKTGFFEKALLGISGGIDSAVACALAAEALGPERVLGVTMPSRHSPPHSVADARALAENLGIDFLEIPIEPAVAAFGGMLAPLFEGTEEGVAEENIQARARGVTLMALSNKFGHLLLVASNKSEAAVGYTTLYGDMAGGLAVLADVLKGQVYALAHHINRRAGREAIPQNTIEKPPSAELRPGQLDQDTLPPYEVLDAILALYLEEEEDLGGIVRRTGHEAALVARVLAMVERSEFKRRQAAPGLRVSARAFRPMPLVMRRS